MSDTNTTVLDMLDHGACPDETDLYELARGTLGIDRAATLRQHIADCDACRIVVAELTAASLAASPRESAPGTRYELHRLLATGGMGEVFLARDNVLGRDVAIKLLREDAEISASFQEARERVAREAQVLASLAHPNVVNVHDQGTLHGRAFLAMEYVRGPTLRQWLLERPDLERVIETMLQAGQGLLAAHDAGVIHRDFKPDNVLLGEDGRARVTDFGIARKVAVSDPPDARGSGTGASAAASGLSGTPAYLAPELVRGGVAAATSDQYAYCVTLHEAIHGCRPSGSQIRALPRRWSRLGDVIARGLSSEPADRYPSMRALLTDLESALVEGRSHPRRRVIALGAAAVGACMLAGIVLVARQRASPSPPPNTAASANTAAPVGLHAECRPDSACPAPFMCRYDDGNSCGVAEQPGQCRWPLDNCDPSRPHPVCGCDGQVYDNPCDAHLHGITVAYGVPCIRCNQQSCPIVTARGVLVRSYCRTSDGRCGSGESGTCMPRPTQCPAQHRPVCGCDGVTYDNPCEARRAGTDVAHPGSCTI